jgi:hypothetical protein
VTDQGRREHLDAEREARDAVVAPNRGRPAFGAVRVALARYLAGEQYRGQRARRPREAHRPKT